MERRVESHTVMERTNDCQDPVSSDIPPCVSSRSGFVRTHPLFDFTVIDLTLPKNDDGRWPNPPLSG